MKKHILLAFSLFLVPFFVFAGKFVFIPVNGVNNLETLFLNSELKIHYYCDQYILATTNFVSYEGTAVLDNNAFADVDFYAIVYCDDALKEEYLSRTNQTSETLYSGEHFLILKNCSNDIMPAKNDGMVAIRDIRASLPVSKADYPTITEPDEEVIGYLSQVSADRLIADVQTLQDFVTRDCVLPSIVDSRTWIKEQYEALPLEVVLHQFPFYDNANVIAIQYGTEFPDEYVVCGAHYDSKTWYPYPPPPDIDSPGADDNATGIAGVLETARILSQYEFKRSIIYCSFSGEEYGLYGSYYYATQCASQIMNIVGYFNLDMTGYLTPGNNIHIDLIYPNSAQTLANYYINVKDVYFPEVPLRSFSNLPGGDSDHTSFNTVGYKGLFPFEDIYEDSPYIHTVDDVVGLSVNNPEQAKVFTQVNLACVATLAMYDQTMPLPVFEPPTNCNAELFQPRRIRITWDAPIENTPYQYDIYRDGVKIGDVPANQLSYVNSLSYGDNDLHCYQVTAIYGTFQSEFSNESCASALNITEYNTHFNIFPNPANEELFIQSEELTINHVEIIDLNGRAVFSNPQIISSSHYRINISSLPSGTYFIKINNVTAGKLIKE